MTPAAMREAGLALLDAIHQRRIADDAARPALLSMWPDIDVLTSVHSAVETAALPIIDGALGAGEWLASHFLYERRSGAPCGAIFHNAGMDDERRWALDTIADVRAYLENEYPLGDEALK